MPLFRSFFCQYLSPMKNKLLNWLLLKQFLSQLEVHVVGSIPSRRFFLFSSVNVYLISVVGPWWWSSGQRSCLLLRRSEFESCWLLNKFSVRKDENKRKRGRGWPIFKKKERLTVSTFQPLM